MGNGQLVDVMIKDGLWDAFNDYHMGVTAENVAKQFDVSREAQDELGLRSQVKSCEAIKNGDFKSQIVPVVVHANMKTNWQNHIAKKPKKSSKSYTIPVFPYISSR